MYHKISLKFGNGLRDRVHELRLDFHCFKRISVNGLILLVRKLFYCCSRTTIARIPSDRSGNVPSTLWQPRNPESGEALTVHHENIPV